MYARATTIQAQPSSIDDGIAHVRDEVMPALMGVEGCVGLSLLVDRESGRCIATSAWQSEEAMRASEEQVLPIRDRAAELFGGSTQVNEWEIAVLHRNHQSPEGASVRATWMEVNSAQMDHAVDIFRMTSLPAIEELEGFCSASLVGDHVIPQGCDHVIPQVVGPLVMFYPSASFGVGAARPGRLLGL